MLTVVYDLDGTLIDTAPDLTAALNAVLAEAGRPAIPPARVRHLVGRGARVLIERGFADTGEPVRKDALDGLVKRFIAVYGAAIADLSRPFPGAVETARALAADGVRLAICTNKPERLSQLLLEALGLTALFPVLIGADTLPQRKPDPAPLREAVTRAGGAIGRTVFIGDSETDVLTARAAGTPVLLFAHGYTPEPAHSLGGDGVFERHGELPGLIARHIGARPAAPA